MPHSSNQPVCGQSSSDRDICSQCKGHVGNCKLAFGTVARICSITSGSEHSPGSTSSPESFASMCQTREVTQPAAKQQDPPQFETTARHDLNPATGEALIRTGPKTTQTCATFGE